MGICRGTRAHSATLLSIGAGQLPLTGVERHLQVGRPDREQGHGGELAANGLRASRPRPQATSMTPLA